MQNTLEPTDLDIENNPVHKALFISSQVNYIMTLLLVRTITEGTPKEEIEKFNKEQILMSAVTVLNCLNDAGFTIVKNEVPAAFKG